MEWLVNWWCGFVGITDQRAIEIAIGITGAGTLGLAALFAWMMFWFVVSAILVSQKQP